MKKRKGQKLPPGWTQARLRQLAKHYDEQSEGERLAEHQAARKAVGHTLMVVPTDLVPQIVRLIQKRRSA